MLTSNCEMTRKSMLDPIQPGTSAHMGTADLTTKVLQKKKPFLK